MATLPTETPRSAGYSQFGEHLDIEDVVGTMPHGYAVDVGACDGMSLSNTYQLEQRGWEVLCIEANPVYEGHLRMNRRNVMILACGKENLENQDFHVYEIFPGNYEAFSALDPVKDKSAAPVPDDARFNLEERFSVKVKVRTLDWCLEQAKFPRVDVVSIDVEGGESDVLDGFDIVRWQPKIIVLEDWEGGKFHDRLAQMGYKLMARRGVNDLFIRG